MVGCSLAFLAGLHGGYGILLLLVFIPMGIYVMTRMGDARKRNTDRRDSLNILQRRLAAGEITPEEFANLKQYL